jgi:hypothetical protein
MLTVDQVRRALGADAPADDRAVEVLRDQADALARVLVEMFREKSRKALRDL